MKCAFSRDSELLACCLCDSTTIIWNLITHTRVILHGHTGSVICCDFYGPLIATGSCDATVKIWDVQTGNCLRTLQGHAGTGTIQQCKFSPDGAILASVGRDHTWKMWNPETGDCLHTLRVHNLHSCVFTMHDNVLLVATVADNIIKVWDACTCTLLYTLHHTGWIGACVCTVDGLFMISVSAHRNRTINVWNMRTKHWVYTQHDMDFDHIDISHDNLTLASVSVDAGHVCIWRMPGQLRLYLSIVVLLVLWGNRDCRGYLPSEIWDWLESETFL